MTAVRITLLAVGLGLLGSGCSQDDTATLTEYVEQVNAIAAQAGERAAALLAEGEQVTDFTPQVLQAGLERGVQEIRSPLQRAADAIEPPEHVNELHDLMWEWHARFITIEEALAERAGAAPDTAAGWTALSDSPEMADYRRAIAEGKQVCTDFQTRLDATASRGVFADVPWVPAELSEAVEAVLGCQWFPENPEDVYRFPPATSS